MGNECVQERLALNMYVAYCMVLALISIQRDERMMDCAAQEFHGGRISIVGFKSFASYVIVNEISSKQ